MWSLFRSKKFRRIAIFLGLFALFVSALRLTGRRIVYAFLTTEVQVQSKGAYSLEYEELDISFLSAKVELTNCYLRVDTAVVDSLLSLTKERKSYFELSVPDLIIDLENLHSIYLKRSLEINKIYVNRPRLEMHNFPGEAKKSTLTLESGNLYTLISNYLDLFEVKHLDVMEAAFGFHEYDEEETTELGIQNLSFAIRNFLVDSTEQADSDRVFYTESIEFVVKDQSYYLPDDIHILLFEEMIISTEKQEILFKNFKIEPREDSPIDYQNNNYNIYHFTLPEFRISGLDFLKAYQANQLHIASISIKDPIYKSTNAVFSTKKEKHGVKPERPENNLMKLVHNFFDQVRVDSFNLTGGYFDMSMARSERFKIGNVELHFGDFHIDSTIAHSGRMLPAYSGIEFNIKDYILDLPDSIHTLRFDELGYSTHNSVLYFDSVSFVTNYSESHLRRMSDRGQYQLYDISFPRISLSGLHPDHILEEQRLELDRFYLGSPDIHLFQHPEFSQKTAPAPKKNEPFQLDDLYDLIKPFLKELSIGEFEIEDARIDFTEKLARTNATVSVQDMDFRLEGFKLNEHSKERDDLLFSKGIGLSLRDCHLVMAHQGHTLDADLIEISTFDELIEFDNLRLKPIAILQDSLKEPLDIFFDRFSIQGFDPKGIIYDKKFEFKRIDLLKPQIVIRPSQHKANQKKETLTKEGTNSLSEIASSIYINDLNVTEAQVKLYKQDQLSMSVEDAYIQLKDFHADPKRLEGDQLLTRLEDLNLGFERFRLALGDSIHEVTIAQLDLSLKDSTGLIRDISMAPIPGRTIPDSANQIRIFVPEISSRQYDPMPSTYTKIWDWGNTVISQPRIQLDLQVKAKDSSQLAGPSPNFETLPDNFMGGLIDTLLLRSLLLDRAQIEVNLHKGEQTEVYRLEALSMALDDIFMDKKTPFQPDRFFIAQSANLDIENFNRITSQDSLSLATLSFNSAEGSILGREAFYSNRKDQHDSTTLAMDIQLPSFHVRGIDSWHLYKEREINLNSIELQKPYAHIDTWPKDPLPVSEDDSSFNRNEAKAWLGRRIKIQPKKLFRPDQAAGQINQEETERLDRGLIAVPTEYPLDSQTIAGIRLAHFHLNDARLDLTQHNGDSASQVVIEKLSLELDKLHMAPGIVTSPNNIMFSEDVRLDVQNLSLPLENNLKQLQVGKIAMSTRAGSFSLEEIVLSSTVSKDAYGAYYNDQRDFIEGTFKHVHLSKLDLHALAHHSAVKADRLILDGIELRVSKNKKLPEQPYTYKPLFHVMLARAKPYVRLDSLSISNMEVYFEELSRIGTEPGKVYIGDISGEGFGFTNDRALLLKQPKAQLNAQALFLGEGRIHLQMDFDLTAPNGDFGLRAQVSELDLSLLNDFFQPNMYVKVDRGILDTLSMVAEANDDYAVGEMEMYYDDLHFTILKADSEEEHVGIGNAFVGLLGNALVKSKNKPSPFPKKRLIYFERLKNKSQINFLVKIAMSGIMSNVGVKSHRKQVKKLQDEALKEKLAEIMAEEAEESGLD